MNCMRFLHAFGGQQQPTVMPVDLAMCLSLSQCQPLHPLLSMTPLKDAQRYCQLTECLPRTSLHSPHRSSSSSRSSSLTSSTVSSESRSCFRTDSGSVNKKRVVFADAKGLALTVVHIFIPEPSSPSSALAIKPSLAKLQGQHSTSNKPLRHKLRLAFPQPMQDFKAFLARLKDMHVQLQSCNISEHSLSGKVCVAHVSVEKSVHIRMTFDSWQSYHDIPCTFLQKQRCGSSDLGVFSFDASLPKNIDPKERIEFCVSFSQGPGTTPHWDNNRGQNYRVCIEKDESNDNQGDDNHCNPTLLKHQLPSWPDLQNLQKNLSVRVRADWRTLCSTA